MTIETEITSVTLDGNGLTTAFAVPLIGGDTSYLSVVYTDTTGTQTTLSPSTYTVTLDTPAPGSIWGLSATLVYPLTGSPIGTGTSLTVSRTVPVTQLISLSGQGDQYLYATERAADLLTMVLQQVGHAFNNAILGNLSDPIPLADLPPIAQRANRAAAFDGDGNLIAGLTPSVAPSAAMAPVLLAATLPLAQAAMGVDGVAPEGLGNQIIDVAGNLGISAGGVSNSNLAHMPTLTLKGNNTGGSAAPSDLTANQVNAMLSLTTNRTGGIGGLNISRSSNTVLAIASGACTSDDNTTVMVLGAFTKTTAAWAVNTGNGGLDTGSIQTSKWYHVFVIERTDTKLVDVLFSLSATAPTLPTNYTKQRRIGSFKTDGSARITAFSQTGVGRTKEYIWPTVVQDINTSNGAGENFLVTLPSVPLGIKVDAIFDCELKSNTLGCSGGVFSPEGGVTASNLAVVVTGKIDAGNFIVRTDTSQHVSTSISAGFTQFTINTRGWYDFL